MALVSVTAGGVGVDLSASSSVVFAELPPDASMVEQAEDRVHRRGVKNAVNVYFLLAHGGAAGGVEERRWASIERQLNRVRRAVNGEDAVDERGLALDGVGVAFQHGSERQEPEARAAEKETDFQKADSDFTDRWLGDSKKKAQKSDDEDDACRADFDATRGIGSVAGSDRAPIPLLPPHPTNLSSWCNTGACTTRAGRRRAARPERRAERPAPAAAVRRAAARR